MNTNKIPQILVGAGLLIAGALLLYFEDYRNSQLFSGLSGVAIFIGGVLIYVKLIEGTAFEKQDNAFSKENPEPFTSRVVRFSGTLIMLAVIFGIFYLIMEGANSRRVDILKTGPTDTTTATVGKIETRRSRSSTSYYAIFIYTVKGKEIFHPRYEDKGDFLTGQQFKIRYAVDYPEMFKIIKALPPTIN